MKFEGFQVTNFRNVIDSGWINANQITAFVGQNEAGKSNLFEALYCVNPIIEEAAYDLSEDWPVDNWPGRREADGVRVCHASFSLTGEEIAELAEAAGLAAGSEDGEALKKEVALPAKANVGLYSAYGRKTGFYVHGLDEGSLDADAADAWAKANVPKFVYIHDYDMSGAQVELTQLRDRWDEVGRRCQTNRNSSPLGAARPHASTLGGE